MLQVKGLLKKHTEDANISFPDFSLNSGGHLAIIGQSGVGKSTLLYILGGLLPPTTGTVEINNQSIYEFNQNKLDAFRKEHIGFIFQDHHLIDSLTVKENIKVAQNRSGQNIDELLNQLNLSHRANAFPVSLSSGEKQRVSIIRGVINEPSFILADEPTSSLDDTNTAEVIELLKGEASRNSASLVVVTHDQRVKSHFDNVLEL